MPRKQRQKGRGAGKYILEGIGGVLGSEFGPIGVGVGKFLGDQASSLLGFGKPDSMYKTIEIGNRTGGISAPVGFNPLSNMRVIGSKSYDIDPPKTRQQGGALPYHPSVGGFNTGVKF